MGVFVSHLKQKCDGNERDEKKMNDTGKSVARTGITFDSALAIAISWTFIIPRKKTPSSSS